MSRANHNGSTTRPRLPADVIRRRRIARAVHERAISVDVRAAAVLADQRLSPGTRLDPDWVSSTAVRQCDRDARWSTQRQLGDVILRAVQPLRLLVSGYGDWPVEQREYHGLLWLLAAFERECLQLWFCGNFLTPSSDLLRKRRPLFFRPKRFRVTTSGQVLARHPANRSQWRQRCHEIPPPRMRCVR